MMLAQMMMMKDGRAVVGNGPGVRKGDRPSSSDQGWWGPGGTNQTGQDRNQQMVCCSDEDRTRTVLVLGLSLSGTTRGNKRKRVPKGKGEKKYTGEGEGVRKAMNESTKG